MTTKFEIKPVTKTIEVLDDVAIGKQALEARCQTLVSRRVLGELMGVSESHILFLEQGKTKWTPERIARHNEGIRKAFDLRE